jgi:hypothetical protein
MRIGRLRPHLSAPPRPNAAKILIALSCLGAFTLLHAQMASAETQGEAIVAAAASQAGVPYCEPGGSLNGPTACGGKPATFDCSGLAMYAVYQATGHRVALPHGVGMDHVAGGVAVSRANLQPGDLVFFGPGFNGADFHHVGIYAGNGMMWDANTAFWIYGDGVQERSLAAIENELGFDSAVRYWNEEGGGGGSPPPPLTEANLLTDGGFERGGESWGTLGPAGDVLNHTSYAGSSARDGTRYEEANSSVAGGSLYQDATVNMQTGQSATFSMWVRLAGTGSSGQVASLCLWALSGGNVSACQSRELSTQWQQLQATATMPAQTSTLRAQIYIPAGVNVDFDGGVLSPDLLVDGGFEHGGEGWGTMGPSGAVLNHTSYAGPSAHDGSRYEEANSSLSGGSLYQDATVNMQTGQSATFSMWVRLAGSGASGQVANLCLWALSGGNVNACQSTELTTRWQQLQATATMPAQTSTLRAQVYVPTGVNVDFDGGSLSPDLLSDGGFERGGEGWGTMGPTGAVLNHTRYAGPSAHDGARYEEANSSLAGGSLYQDVPVNMEKGQSATFSMWVRLAGSGASGQVANLCLWALSGGNVNACQAKELTTQWQQLQATTTMPAPTSTLRAQVYIPAGVNVDFDGGSLGAPQTADPVYPPGPPAAEAAAATTSAPVKSGDPAHTATAHRSGSAGACVVPLLKHKTLIAAKHALRHADCRLGTVHRRKDHHGALRVSGQSARVKSGHQRGYRVAVTLG